MQMKPILNRKRCQQKMGGKLSFLCQMEEDTDVMYLENQHNWEDPSKELYKKGWGAKEDMSI